MESKNLALKLAQIGWYVFPCGSDKKPLCKWKSDSTNDLDIVDVMDWPGLVGIYCQKSGLFAIDLDRKNGVDGLAIWENLENHFGKATAGPAQQTPSGGKHLLFKLPDNITIPNKAGWKVGIDLRSEGYICTGPGYQWITPPETPVPSAPGWFLDHFDPELEIKNLVAIATDLPTNEPHPQAADYWLDKYLPQAAIGRRNETGFNLACQCRDSGITQAEAEALPYPERCPQGKDIYSRVEWLLTVKSAYDRTPREAAKLGKIAAKMLPIGDKIADNLQDDPIIYSSWDDLSTDPIEFIWKPWLANGFLSLLVSRSGDGKSLLALRLCGCFIKGLDWPDNTPFIGERGSVLWIESEAAQALNRDRAHTWKYPLKRIITPFADPLEDANLDDLNHRVIIEARAALPEVKFIVIDSLSGSSRKRENDTEIKDITLWAAKLARDLHKPITLIHHLGKMKEWDNGEITLDRVRGSSAIVQFARIIWALSVPDPTNKETKRLEQIKNNLARFPEPIGMTAGENGIFFGLAPTAPHVETTAEQCGDLLLDLLQQGEVKATIIEEELTGAGLSMVTANRQKKKLGIISIKRADGWYWGLPARGIE